MRFVQALALVSSLGACGASPPPNHFPGEPPCGDCRCDLDSTDPASCFHRPETEWDCCGSPGGPLAPPDLPAT